MNDDEILSIVSKDSPGLPPRQQVLASGYRQAGADDNNHLILPYQGCTNINE